jgi:hypothetical protein
MTKEELLKALSECDEGDEEVNHVKADDLLLEYINDPEITLAFESIDKWYA